MNQVQMQICQRCGGARFFGSGTVGWGGPICNCQYPQIPNPDVPPPAQFNGMGLVAAPFSEIISLLRQILAKLDALKPGDGE
jgi:hypothetical protein